MNKRSKSEQMFVLLLIFVMCSIVFCFAGCGGVKSCETPKCGDSDVMGVSMIGVSVPGCGGLFSSGQGCGFDTCGLWSQSIKGVAGYDSKERIIEIESNTQADNKRSNDKISSEDNTKKVVDKDRMLVLGCDNQYYKNEGCGGCMRSDNLRSCYGVLAVDNPVDWFVAVGHTPGDELYGGCGRGCLACGTKSPGRKLMTTFEIVTEIQ